MGSSKSRLREDEFWQKDRELQLKFKLEDQIYFIRNGYFCPTCNTKLWDPPVANQTYPTSKHASTTTHASARALVASLQYKGHDQGTSYHYSHRANNA